MTSRATFPNTLFELPFRCSPLTEMAEVLGHRYLDLLAGVTREIAGQSEETGSLTLSELNMGFHRDLEGLLQLSARAARHPVVHLLLTECLEVRREFSGFLQSLSNLLASTGSGTSLDEPKRDLWQRNQRLVAKLNLVRQLAERLEITDPPISEAA